MVDRQAAAWDARDAEALVSLFHPDMVWPWPPDATAHDPARWVFPFGRYNRQRWKAEWEQLFRTHDLVHNHRAMVWIMLSKKGDGAFAVVDVDTLWRHCPSGEPLHWKGRACKEYSEVGARWLLAAFHGSPFDIAGVSDERTLILEIFVYISLTFTLLTVPFVELLRRQLARHSIAIDLAGCGD